MAAWENSNRVTYKYDGMERLDYEEREDWTGAAWSTRYDNTQEYDKDGNRTRLHKNVAAGHTADYGQPMDLSYTYNSVNALTAIADSDDGTYSATVTCDANNNITEIHENETSGGENADLYTYFTLDWANRVTDWSVKRYDFNQNDWQWTKREHGYDPIGRLINSTYKQWWDQEQEPAGDSLEHIYAGSRHLQNTDDGSNFGERWHWAGAQHAHNAPVKSPNADTASTAAFNIANDKTPQRRTFTNPTTEGDERHLYGQGKPMPKDSSGSGANWGTGIQSDDPNGVLNPMNSRLDFDGTVAPTDLDRATDAREKGRIGIFGSALSYAGSSPRVTSETIGRDINPLGRGSGMALVGGELNLGSILPELPQSQAISSLGSSVTTLRNGFLGYSVVSGHENNYSMSFDPSIMMPYISPISQCLRTVPLPGLGRLKQMYDLHKMLGKVDFRCCTHTCKIRFTHQHRAKSAPYAYCIINCEYIRFVDKLDEWGAIEEKACKGRPKGFCEMSNDAGYSLEYSAIGCSIGRGGKFRSPFPVYDRAYCNLNYTLSDSRCHTVHMTAIREETKRMQENYKKARFSACTGCGPVKDRPGSIIC